MTPRVGTEIALNLAEVKPIVSKGEITPHRTKGVAKTEFDLAIKDPPHEIQTSSDQVPVGLAVGSVITIPTARMARAPTQPGSEITSLGAVGAGKKESGSVSVPTIKSVSHHNLQADAGGIDASIQDAVDAQTQMLNTRDFDKPHQQNRALELGTDTLSRRPEMPTEMPSKTPREQALEGRKRVGEKDQKTVAGKMHTTRTGDKSDAPPALPTASASPIISTMLDKISVEDKVDADIPAADPDSLTQELSRAGTSPIRQVSTRNLPRQDVQVARSIGIQIRETVASGNGRAIEVALDPVELGKVKLTLQSTENGMNVQIVADRMATVDLMRRHEAIIQQEFKDLGYQNLSFSFSQNDSRQQPDFDFVSDETWSGPENKARATAVAPLVASSVRVIGKGSLDLRL